MFAPALSEPTPRIEGRRSSVSAWGLFGCVFITLLAVLVFGRTLQFAQEAGSTAKHLTDFDAFYVVGHLVWRGAVQQAYQAETMLRAQQEFGQGFLPWSYPPPYDLLVAPLALLKREIAYAVFVLGTLGAYLLVLARIARARFPLVLLVVCPSLFVSAMIGQNGFLTGALAGLACIGMAHGRAVAGVPLGLLVIKPHLAVGLALSTATRKRRRIAMVAAATLALACLAATAAFGPSVWTAFLHGVSETRGHLESGALPLFRMISPFAFLRTAGVPSGIAMAAQVGIACLAAASVLAAVRRKASPPQVLGVAIVAGLLMSPYAYDYDLPMLGIGLALLMPDLDRLATRGERILMLGSAWLACACGSIQVFAIIGRHGEMRRSEDGGLLALAAPFLLVVLALSWRIIRRAGAETDAAMAGLPAPA